MWTWIIQIVLSILIIWTGHSLWNYFINNFSKQKTRDLVSIHTEKYKYMIQELTQKIQEKEEINNASMQIDLEQFMNEIIDNKKTI